jgi:hypothetical protein
MIHTALAALAGILGFLVTHPGFTVVLLAAGFSAWAVYRLTISRHALERHRAWAMHWRIWLRLRPGPGFASLTELWLRWGRVAALGHGARARPSLGMWARFRAPSTDYAVRFGRAQYGRRAFGRMADQTLILSPPQQGKSGLLADRIIDHPGPVVSTSTRADLFENTAGLRARRGPVHTFNPLGIGGVPSTFGWNPVAGCEDPATAIRRAQDFTGDREVGDLAWWAQKASAALASLLHAAALAPATMTDVYSWVAGEGVKRAENILDNDPRAWPSFRAAFAEIRDDGKTAGSIRATISQSLTWVTEPALVAAVNPPPGTGFDVAAFIRRNGVLYVIAPGSETAPVAPLVQALVQHVHFEAGLIGSRMPAGKLDPPLWLALDELTQIVPVPLPAMLADSAGKGILITAVVHSYGQLESRWGKPGAETVWATCGTKILLGGITDPVTLEHVTRVCGVVGVDSDRNVPSVPPELLRMLPKWRALILSLNLRPVVVKTRPVWHRPARWFGRAPVPVPVLKAAPAPLRLAPLPIPATARAPEGNGHPVAVNVNGHATGVNGNGHTPAG